MKIVNKIKNAREDKDLTQTEIAKSIGMDQSNYSKIERDLQEPSLDQLKGIALLLNLDLNDLLGIKEDKTLQRQKDLQYAKESKALYEKYYKWGIQKMIKCSIKIKRLDGTVIWLNIYNMVKMIKDQQERYFIYMLNGEVFQIDKSNARKIENMME